MSSNSAQQLSPEFSENSLQMHQSGFDIGSTCLPEEAILVPELGKVGNILLKYCNEVIYKLMVEVNESPHVSTEGHILERRSEHFSGWVRAMPGWTQ